MKSIIRLSSMAIVLAIAVTSFCSCGKDDPTPAEQKTSLLIEKPWKVQSVIVDGVDYTSLFTNMTVTFTKSTFQIVNGGPMWLPSGTWQFKDGKAEVITMEDGKELTVTIVDKSQLKFTLDWSTTTFSGGRSRTIQGQHTFTFTH